jgi:hypothetical protein
MKKITTILLTAFVLCLLITSKECRAQQTEAVKYSYKVFQAPNKNYGYDIYKNGKIVYHEFASINQPENFNPSNNTSPAKLNGVNKAPDNKENLALVKSGHAEKAALLAIEKMKRNELPVLSRDEIKQITAR